MLTPFTLESLRTKAFAGWLKSLDNLAYYCMAVAAMVTGSQGPHPGELAIAAISTVLLGGSPNPSLSPSSTPDQPSMSEKSAV